MLEIKNDWGRCEITLNEYLIQHKISKRKLSRAAEIQYSQLQAYCKNEIQRPDLGVLARICRALECDSPDLLRYIPPEEE